MVAPAGTPIEKFVNCKVSVGDDPWNESINPTARPKSEEFI